MIKKSTKVFIKLFLSITFLLFIIINLNISKGLDNSHIQNLKNVSLSEEDKLLMTKMYNENTETAFFSTEVFYNENTNDFDPYRLEYYLRINKEILGEQPDKNYTLKVIKYINNIKAQDIKKYNFNFICRLSYIESLIQNKVDDEFYINYLMKHFDSNSGLFFEENINDDLYKKICNTNLALKIMKNLNYIPSEFYEGIYKNLNNYVGNLAIFTFDTNDFDKNIKNNLIILENTVLFNQLSAEKIDIGNLEEWYKFWNNYFFNYINKNTYNERFINSIIFEFNNIDKEYQIVETKSNSLFNKYVNHLKQMNSKDILSNDIKLFYENLKIISEIDVNYKPENLTDLINNYEIYLYDNTPQYNIKEQYFAFMLAKDNIDIDIEKIKQISNRNLELITTLEEGYYYLILKNELNDYENPEKMFNIFNKIITKNINLNKLTFSDLYYCLYINKSLKLNLIEDKDILNIINSNEDLNFKTDRDLYYYVLLKEFYNQTINEELLANNIHYFMSTNNIFKISRNEDFENIISSYRMINLCTKYNIPIDSASYSKYLKLVRGPYGGYALQVNDTLEDIDIYLHNITFESWYYGAFLENLLLNKSN